MKDWKDNVISFMRENSDKYFTINYLSNRFYISIKDLKEFLSLAYEHDIIDCFEQNINGNNYELYTYIE